jgi:hypothetical protein
MPGLRAEQPASGGERKRKAKQGLIRTHPPPLRPRPARKQSAVSQLRDLGFTKPTHGWPWHWLWLGYHILCFRLGPKSGGSA